MASYSNSHFSFLQAFFVGVIALFIGGVQCSSSSEGMTALPETTAPDTTDILFRKTIPEEVIEATSEALSYYPELKATRIVFSYDEEFHNSFMQAQPKISSLFGKRKNRTYKVIMTRQIAINDTIIPVEKVPHKVLVGWIGHELGHIMDYTHRSSANMAWFGFRYITSDKFKTKAERQADVYAIKHGLAEHIIATKNFILSNTALPKTYIEKIERLYLSPENVLEIVEELEDELDDEEETSATQEFPDFSFISTF